MLRFGVVAAVFVGVSSFLVVQGRAAHASNTAPIQHTCGLTDREFIVNYQLELENVGVYGGDYLSGDAKAKQVESAADDAAQVVRAARPLDPSLKTVRALAPVMFLDYAAAVKARSAGRDAGREMYLAYDIGARVQYTLQTAQQGLAAKGCDVGDLLQ
ncbi:MAG TPA: hypothetical protein VFB25_04645 [Gaiellaceae bacterium]|nr:hypothetical protein [Gaiellaceae bacterium]